jgi:hypothetical protein
LPAAGGGGKLDASVLVKRISVEKQVRCQPKGDRVMPYTCKNNDWTLEKYRSLRSEVIERIKMQKQLEVFSLTAAALIWGGASISDVPEMALWVGVCAGLVVFACALLAAYESQAIFKTAAYIAAKFERDPQLGVCWDSMTHDKRIPMYATHRMPLNRHSDTGSRPPRRFRQHCSSPCEEREGVQVKGRVYRRVESNPE